MSTIKVSPTMDNDAMEDERLPVQAVSFTQFTQGTSFHGVNYIFKPGATPVRRVTWVVAFLTCITLFLYQVITRVHDYYDYPSNVNVEVIYDNESVAFPAVTFCNQNSFRASATTQIDMQNVIMEKYSAGGGRRMKSKVPEGLNLTYREFVQAAAHQKEDMLQLCTFANEPCTDEDFIQTITDFGVCYTFNGGNTSLTLDDYGSDNGLTIVLNIEKYENMPGPHNDIGIKVLLHDPEEFPLIKGQGFTIGSGQHVLMAMRMSQTQSLSHPYGKCIVDAQPRSYCRLQCEADKMIEKYCCHDAYIPETLNASYCTLKGAISKNLKGLKAKCTCDVPCIRTRYSADLSYADISAEFAQRFWESRQDEAISTTNNYIQAKEYIHRHYHGIFEPTASTYGAFTAAFDRLVSIAADMDEYLANSLSGNTTGSPVTIDTVISDDLATIRDVYKNNTVNGSEWNNSTLSNPIYSITQQPLRQISINLNTNWIKNLAEPLTYYLNNEDARKYDLYRTLTSEPYTFTMLDMQDKFAGYLLDIRTRNNGLQTYFDDVIDSFKQAYTSLPVSVITTELWINELKTLKFVDADENFQNDSAILNLVQEVRNNGPDAVTSLGHLLQNISSQYQNYLQQETDKMETLIQHISITMTDIKSDLQKFGDMAAVVVDRSNFIQLDIFYEELSYSRIKQQESFPFISLLSEIGGFLGLLLGASVLTVCEILDFTIIAVMNRINMAKFKKTKK